MSPSTLAKYVLAVSAAESVLAACPKGDVWHIPANAMCYAMHSKEAPHAEVHFVPVFRTDHPV